MAADSTFFCALIFSIILIFLFLHIVWVEFWVAGRVNLDFNFCFS